MHFFLFYSTFLFSASNAVLLHRNRVEVQDLNGNKKKCDDFNIFYQNVMPKCAIALMFCSNVLVSNINKVRDFVMNEKNSTFISCVFNGFKYILETSIEMS